MWIVVYKSLDFSRDYFIHNNIHLLSKSYAHTYTPEEWLCFKSLDTYPPILLMLIIVIN